MTEAVPRHLIAPATFSPVQRTAVSFGVVYQIYPSSFADGNGDGTGDFPGIIAKLDYLADLGIDSVWLSPHYPSPGTDCGYDVSNYCDVAPEHGALADFERFLTEAHDRDMKVIVDAVWNHSSEMHPWFIESRSSTDNPKRDWYVWHPGVDGGPPNNWMAAFGGPAWTLDERTGEYYYHYFFASQPDLNWHNPEVKEELFASARFWLDLGVDGYRLDAIGTLFEDPDLTPHACPLPQSELLRRRLTASTPEEWEEVGELFEQMYGLQRDLPEVHAVFRELRALVDEYDGRLLLGETGEVDYYGSGDDELHLLFNFPLMDADRMSPAWVRSNQAERLATVPAAAWPCNTLGNHDRPRVRSEFGDGVNDEALARVNAALVLTLRGTPVLYNGEEIGMTDVPLDDPARFRDHLSTWAYREGTTTFGWSDAEAIGPAVRFGRDRCRTPMQWSSEANAGFCPEGVEPWLPIHPNHATGVNVADQRDDPDSMLSYYRRLIHARRHLPPLILGGYEALDESGDHLAFARTHGGERVIVVLDYSGTGHTAALGTGRGTVVFSSDRERDGASVDLDAVAVAPFEVLLVTA
jgi:alpha-glucosidase